MPTQLGRRRSRLRDFLLPEPPKKRRLRNTARWVPNHLFKIDLKKVPVPVPHFQKSSQKDGVKIINIYDKTTDIYLNEGAS